MSKPCEHCRLGRASHVRAARNGPARCADGVTDYKPARDAWNNGGHGYQEPMPEAEYHRRERQKDALNAAQRASRGRGRTAIAVAAMLASGWTP